MAESKYGRDNKGRFAKRTNSYTGQFNNNKSKLSSMMVNTWPNAIVEDDGVLNLEETVDNYAYILLDKFDDTLKKKWFGYIIETPEECYSWIITELPDLYDKCATFIEQQREAE